MGAPNSTKVPAQRGQATAVARAHSMRAPILILLFGIVLLAFSHAGFAVISGVRHGMMP